MYLRKFKYIVILLSLLPSVLMAQYHYFGRNKIQYTEFDWQVLKTEHFDIYFYPQMKNLAEIGARYAEDSYKHLEVKFNFNVNRRIPLIFYSSHLHFQQTNITPGFIPEGVGGFFEFMKGRVVIPFMGSLSSFKHVIQHELVHVFMHSKIIRTLKDHRVPLERYPPLWFVEGLAEYWSAEWDDQAEMILRDAVLQDYIVGLGDIEQISGSFVMYKVGQHILNYIAKTYGEEKILLLMENVWKGNYFADVLKKTIGKNFIEFDKDYIYNLKKQYFPLLSGKDQPSAASKEIQVEGFNAKPVVYKHGDTTEVIFIGNMTGYTSLYKKNLNQPGKPELLLQGEKTDELEVFHSNNSKISVNNEGILAFATKSGETDVLHFFDINEEKIIKTLRFPELVMITSPNWASDGERIAFAGVNNGGSSDLYVYNLKNEKLVRLTNDMYDDHDPCFSPDGKTLVFSSDRSSTKKLNLFNINIESGEIKYLTFGNENYHTPAYTDDGTKIVFTCDIDGVQNIWALEVNKQKNNSPFTKNEIRRITNFTTSAFDPVVKNDDLVFTCFEKYKMQVRYINNFSKIFDTTKAVYYTDIFKNRSPWSFNSIKSKKEDLFAVKSNSRNYMPVLLKSRNESDSISFEKYKESYDLDLAVSQVSTDPVFGTSAGAVIALSDILGNDQYYFLIYNNAQTKDEILESFNVAISRISLMQRTNYAYGIFHFSGRRYDLMDPDEYYWERVYGGYLVLSYPLSVFRRIEVSSELSNSDKNTYIKQRKALLLSNSVSFIHDNSMWSATGPIDGSRIYLTLAYTTDIKTSNVSYYTLMADYRYYLRLSQRSAFATRFQFYWNEGKEARRFFMGGSWDLRGYPRWGVRGKKLWLTSQELRFPLIDAIGVKFPFGGIGFGAIKGALFFDAGNAWDEEYERTLGSFGLGFRLNFLGAIVFRYDMGYLLEDNFRKVSKSMFSQFFFGWDF